MFKRISSTLMLLVFLAGTQDDARAWPTLQPSASTVVQDNSPAGIPVILVQGRRPPAAKPKFNAAAKPRPLVTAPPKPVALPKSITGRPLPQKPIAQRAQTLSFPKQVRGLATKPAVSAVAARLNIQAVKPTARVLAQKPVTPARKTELLSQIAKVRDNLKQARNQKVSYGLKFGKNDLIYGVQSPGGATGQLKKFRDLGGGGTMLSSMNKPTDKNWWQFSRSTLDNAARTGHQVRFNLTGMKDIQGVLAGRGKQSDLRIYQGDTAKELRHIRDNWNSFKVKPKFYRNAIEVRPPWLVRAP